MIPYLPPLQTLRAFEAAARHLSYSRAAQELSLTHGAISQHIARLERDLEGIRLFVREGQRMILTEAGQVLILEVREGLNALAQAFDNARARPRLAASATPLTISVLPSLALRWLVPRLPAFQAQHPHIEIAIRPTAMLAALDGRDGIDLAIRYGRGSWPGLHALKLMKSTLFPVCSPGLLAQSPMRTPSDWLHMPLLRNPRQAWRPWFRAAGLEAPAPSQGPVYDDAGLTLQAAISGQGVALARDVLVADDLATGRLVRVSDTEMEDTLSWFLVWREPLLCNHADFETLRDWLITEGSLI
ncbi:MULTISPECIES: transcriptional regulator GcvA [unclassified Pseudomonas]|uniref:transcriptional regulator GcvA n=1 Tax=unclassified Pseudomonas TaxID=196821 RepID=UPI0015A479E3|nr:MULTISPECIES: transcriptional regulator GcvA [unclassified Pseudomonas]NWC96596.1 transcriptional regulator GcvA [Pseudomonas sp. IPO3779]NWD21175.1 transcriptional regulator GcvA [Pseudomonas sp. IPO3778]